jgi:hypothetical protein
VAGAGVSWAKKNIYSNHLFSLAKKKNTDENSVTAEAVK